MRAVSSRILRPANPCRAQCRLRSSAKARRPRNKARAAESLNSRITNHTGDHVLAAKKTLLTRSRVRMRRIAPLLALMCAMLAIYTTQAGAATWTQLSTGTTATITSIDYSTGTVIFTTSNGGIFKQSGSAFAQVENDPGVVFNQVRMNGSLGLAVGNGGAVFRTTDSGEKWAQESSIMADESDGCASAVPLGSVYAIGWASSSEVFIAAANNQID